MKQTFQQARDACLRLVAQTDAAYAESAASSVCSDDLLAPRHAETWAQIVAYCLSETQSSINVGSNKRRTAILAVNDILAGANDLSEGSNEA